MPDSLIRAGFGLRVHSGWAALVAVARSASAPSTAPLVVDRRRIELADPKIPGSRQPYHAAAGRERGSPARQRWTLEEAERFLTQCKDRGRLLARQALRALIAELGAQGYDVRQCGVILGSGPPTKSIAETLASHALIHAAEGQFFREMVLNASQDCGLSIAVIRERELWARAAAELGVSAPELERRLTEMGRPVGRPWRQDEKYAALIAWLALGLRLH